MNKDEIISGQQSDSISALVHQEENKWFDIKRAEIQPNDLAKLVSAFSNTEGGKILIGVDDKTRTLRGIRSIGHQRLNDLLETPKKHCRPMPAWSETFIDIANSKGEPDQLLLLHIEESKEQIVRTADNSTYVRVGDRTLEVKGEDLRNLEYRKGIRRFEDEPCPHATLEDLDETALALFKQTLQAESIPTEQILRSRGLLTPHDGQWVPTNSAMLLFAREVGAFYPNCRVRFVRFSGEHQGVGSSYNVEKDVSFDTCLLKLLPQVKEFLKSQLRDFTALDPEKGIFVSVPEYPEFAWLEGLANAITHREYALAGDYILVSMYDDRLVISSPGALPGPVTVANMCEMRYSRNPRIARVLSECGWVRELNEGVKRIFAEMKHFVLDAPEYHNSNNKVSLTLRNNAEVRRKRRLDKAKQFLNGTEWAELDELEKKILSFLTARKKAPTRDIVAYTGRSKPTVAARMRKLQEKGIIKSRSLSPRDPHQTYELAEDS